MSRTKRTQPLRVADLTPASTLSKEARAEFQRIVESVAEHHFAECDRPLIAAYAEAICNLREAQKQLDSEGMVDARGKINPWITVQEKQIRAITGLSLRLRLSPSSRFDRTAAGVSSRPQLPSLKNEDPLLQGYDPRLDPKRLDYYRLTHQQRSTLAAQLGVDDPDNDPLLAQ